MRSIACAVLVASLVVLAGEVRAEDKPLVPDTVTFQPDQTYGLSKSQNALKLDLVYPKKSNEPSPCVLMFHGGAWIGGSRKEWTAPAGRIAERGYVVAVIGYTLVPDATINDQLAEAQQAYRWLIKNAGEYGIDTQRVAVLGSSSGAQLAGLFVVETNRDAKQAKIQALLLYAPVTDMPAMYAHYEKQGGIKGSLALKILNNLMTGTPISNAKNYRKGSLAEQVDQYTPPTLVIQDPKDTVVPFEQSEILVGKLKSVGVAVQLKPIKDLGHGYSETKKEEYDGPTMRFLDERLKPRSAQR